MREEAKEGGWEMRVRALNAIACCALLAVLSVGVVDAAAYRAPAKQSGNTKEQEDQWIPSAEMGRLPPATEGQIEGACGLAISPVADTFLVSDYYHRAIHTFSLPGNYDGTEFLAGGNPPPVQEPINELDAVCGLAIDGTGNLYANEFHQRVLRLPGEETIDSDHSTGLAVDSSGNLYVDDRTYVAVYDAPVSAGDEPAEKIGLGSLTDAYGVAVDSKAGRIYVPDAFGETVKVFEPLVSLVTPVQTIAGPPGIGFNSLANTSLAVDESPTEGEGHLLVVDDLKPRFAFPEAAIYEFGSDGTYLDRLQVRTVGPIGETRQEGPIFGEPPGIAVDQKTGDLYVTTGNSDAANVVKYGPFQKEAPPAAAAGAEGGSGALAEASSVRSGGEGRYASAGGASASVVQQRRGVRVGFDGTLTPHVLPRHGTAPVGIVVDAKISATQGEDPPQLRRIAIAINRNGRFASKGLPICRISEIQPSTTDGALAACRDSLVGEGGFSANVKLPQQSPFPSAGKVLAFNGTANGKPAILAHIYGTQPAPTSIVLPFVLRKGHGTYGTILEASLPQATGSWGYVTGLRMNLRRRFIYRGRSRSFLSAGCPAPAGFPSASFPLAKTSFAFAGSLTLEAVLTRTCRARG
jgi:DNA-binding beta-propeller fold protein YncE